MCSLNVAYLQVEKRHLVRAREREGERRQWEDSLSPDLKPTQITFIVIYNR